ncbi:dUTP diphosphatase [Peptoniphilus sp. GNH]|nr:dUTP diphosphatase [Clostridiales bacterium KA00134]UHR02927.1 dUTP diphosphatase [Peptoniphilus sp. GNH]
MKLKILNKSKNPLPAYQSEGASGLDLMANLESPLIIKPLERTLIPTGIYVEIPEGYEGQVRMRSGLALKKGLSLPNGIGTIDWDYRGELKVIVINLSREDIKIENGERIAQFVLMKVQRAELEEVFDIDDMSKTQRAGEGFGSTGLK